MLCISCGLSTICCIRDCIPGELSIPVMPGMPWVAGVVVLRFSPVVLASELVPLDLFKYNENVLFIKLMPIVLAFNKLS